jgi:hypothetical protein
VAEIKRFRSYHFQNSRAECGSSPRIGRTAHDQEFFSAPAHQNIRLTHDRREPLRHELQQSISRRMTMLVVHFFEEVHVNHDEY